MYRTLDSGRIVETADALRTRVEERFPGSGLGKVAAEVAALAREAHERGEAIRRPNLPLRAGIAVLVAAALGGLVLVATRVRATEGMWLFENFVGEVNNLLGALVFLGAAIAFLVSLETRIKRRKALEALTELRAVAHIVDMHQLTKDPEPLLLPGPTTLHSPKRTMTPFELSRYLDYCTELLSLLSKVGAVYVAAFPDPVAMDAADDIEELCSGLSQKVWQKLALLDRFARPGSAQAKEVAGGPA